MRTLIVDDDELSRIVIENLVEQHPSLTLAGTCVNALEAVKALRDVEVDLIFLDIEMPDMSGLDLVRSLASPPQVVIISGKEEYALDAFDIDVTDYLLKPVTHARFLKAVERAMRRRGVDTSLPTATPDDRVFIKADGKLVQLDLATVLWIEAQADYMLIHTASERYLIHGTMKAMEEKLPAADFVRIHRSYIVRIDQIKDIQDQSLVISRKVLPIGASYREALVRRLRTL